MLDVEADGPARVEVAREDFRNADGSPNDWTDSYAPETFKVRPDGTITERLSGRQLLELLYVQGPIFAAFSEIDGARPLSLPAYDEGFLSGLGIRVEDGYRSEPAWPRQVRDFPVPLPSRALAPGDTWSRQQMVTVHGVTFNATINGTLERIERSGDGRIARLRIRIEGRGTGRPFSGLPSGVQVQRTTTFRRVLEVAWSVERGRLVQSTEDELRDSTSTFVAQAGSSQARTTSREITRHQS